jgi:hypothetical protein
VLASVASSSIAGRSSLNVQALIFDVTTRR